MSAFTFASFAAHLHSVEKDLHRACDDIVAYAAARIRETAQDAIGTYMFGWSPLGPAAIAKHGNTPLLDTGQLQRSISITLGKGEAWVGTNDPAAAFQEFGTSRIPPRPFMAPAAMAVEGEVIKFAQRRIAAAFAGRGAHAGELREFMEALHLLKEVYHHVKEAVEDALSDDEGTRR